MSKVCVRAALAGVLVGLAVGVARGQEIDEVSYQGRLLDGGAGASGSFSLRFRVYDAAVGGALLGEHTSAVVIGAGDNGVFRVDDLPFGGVFDGTEAWMEIRVTPSGGGSAFTLEPRQLVTLSPHAGYAQRSGTTLQEAFDNGAGLQGTLDIGGTTNGRLRVFGDFTSNILVDIRNDATRGGRVDVRDTNNNIAVFLGIDPHGGGRMTLNRMGTGETGFAIDGNVVNSGATRVDIMGPSRTIVLDTSAEGDASVVLPDSSIGSAEILDEPGVAEIHVNNALVNLTTTVGPIVSRTITVPGPGFVVAMANVEMLVGFNSGSEQAVDLGLSDVSNAFFEGMELSYDIPANVTTGSYNFVVSPSLVFPVGAAGPKTIYVVGSRFGGSAANVVRVSDAQMTLLYVPTSYGTVGTSAALSNPGGPDGAGPSRAGLSAAEIAGEQLAEAQRHNAALAARQRVLEAELRAQRERLEALETAR